MDKNIIPKWKRGNKSNLLTTPIEDGNILLATDTNELYVDIDGKRIPAGNNNIVELTQAEYDALPDSKLSNNVLYLIKDDIVTVLDTELDSSDAMPAVASRSVSVVQYDPIDISNYITTSQGIEVEKAYIENKCVVICLKCNSASSEIITSIDTTYAPRCIIGGNAVFDSISDRNKFIDARINSDGNIDIKFSNTLSDNVYISFVYPLKE